MSYWPKNKYDLYLKDLKVKYKSYEVSLYNLASGLKQSLNRNESTTTVISADWYQINNASSGMFDYFRDKNATTTLIFDGFNKMLEARGSLISQKLRFSSQVLFGDISWFYT